ncbi:MAG: TrmH family RNA methyltransferase [Actinomycetota bacterium]
MITSASNPEIRAVASLHRRSERDKTKTFLIEGAREIDQALAAGLDLLEVYFLPGVKVPTGIGRAVEVGPAAFEKIAYGRDGIVAVAKQPVWNLEMLELAAPALVLVAEAIEKPGNLGAIMRTAEAAGASVIVANPLTDLGNPNVVRASLGGLFSIPVAQSSTEDAIDYLRSHGVAIAAAIPDGGHPPWQEDLRGPIALVVGSEDRGLSPPWLEVASVKLTIPISGRLDSLNTSVAAAVLLYEVVRQRQRM